MEDNREEQARRSLEEKAAAKALRAEVGKRIIQARKDLGMRQVELAGLLGVAERTVMGYESGELGVWKHLPDLVRILGRPAMYFTHGDDVVVLDDVKFEQLQREIVTSREEVAVLTRRIQSQEKLLKEILALLLNPREEPGEQGT